MADKKSNPKIPNIGQISMVWFSALGGYLVYYLLLVEHQFAHPLHWVSAGLGAGITVIALNLCFGKPLPSGQSAALPNNINKGLAVGLAVVSLIVLMALAYS